MLLDGKEKVKVDIKSFDDDPNYTEPQRVKKRKDREQSDFIVYAVIFIGAIALSSFSDSIFPFIVGFGLIIYLYSKNEG